MTCTRSFRVAAALAAVAAGACSHSSAGSPSATPSPKPAPSAQGEQAAIAKARADSARHPYTDADIQFMTGMIGHHAQAIVMSGWAPTHGASPSLQVMAERIINAQQDEIATMQTWLRDRQQPVPEAKPGPMKMKMNGMEHEMLMPGMLTDAQMHELDAAKGPEFDRLFLTYMIQHHRGAVSMVQNLFSTPGAAEDEVTFKLANDVSADQTSEITRMETMLAALTPERHTQ
jgi:uncharacterized protein (DUF305 family)